MTSPSGRSTGPRLLLLASALLCGSVAAQVPTQTVSTGPGAEASPKAWRKPARDRQRRIIFNNDGNEAFAIMTRPSVQDMLDARTTALVGSQVDSIFYCTCGGFGTFTHLTKIGQVYTLQHPPHDHNQMEALLKAGIDPLKVMVDFGRQHGIEVFWSFRMNDVHDFAVRQDYQAARFRFNQLKNEHPEYLLGVRGKPLKHGGWSGVNYALPQVRELAFRYTEEVCSNYDVDGVELDFFRHPVFFKATTRGKPVGDDERAAMTDLMRRIRRMADDVGRRRGRPILIAMRVPDSVEYCRAIGLDIEKWLADDLLDLMVVSSYFKLNDWEYSVALGHKYDVKVYPSLDESRVRDESARRLRSSLLAYRGRAANIWAAGADGVYIFNSFDPKSALWRELGDPKVLAARDCDYFGSVRGAVGANGGNLPIGPFQKIETLNPANPKPLRPGGKQTARVKMGAGASGGDAVRMRLRLRFDPMPKPEAIEIAINGHPLKAEPDEKGWLQCPLRPADVRPGTNEVEVALAPDQEKGLKWQDVLIEVRH